MKYRIVRHGDSGKKNIEGLAHWRLYALVFLFLSIIFLIIFRLYSLQVTAYETYKELADGQHSIFQKLIPKRGEIFLRDKSGTYPLAVNQETKIAYAVPKEIENPDVAAKAVAEVLQLDEGEIKSKLNKPDDGYEVLKHRLSDEEIDKINSLKIKGIHLSDETYRYYPSGELAAQVVGFLGWKENILAGRYGIEASFEDKLKGSEGQILHDRDTAGRWITVGGKEVTEAKDGDSIVLTIDHIVQYEAEKIIKSAVEKFGANGGSIIVTEPETGKILAMADYPTFNPNDYSKVDDIGVYVNSAISGTYESGSVFKAITMSAGVDDGKVNANTTYVDSGAVKEAGYTIKNSDLKANGTETMTQVLEKSLNTGVIFVEKLLGNKKFADYVTRFGFGEKSGIDLPGESAGNINNLKDLKSNIQFFTSSFGQGIAITPIQLVDAYSAIANGGVLMKPQIVEKIIHSDGTEEEVAPQEIRRVISESTAQEVSKMLESVVVNGHGKQAGVPGYKVAGKTGTAQVASLEHKGYVEGTNVGSFAGFAPLDNPKFAILVKMDNPKNVQWAESSAAPTFGELMKFLLEYYNVEPTENYTQADLDKFNQVHNLNEFFLKDAGTKK